MGLIKSQAASSAKTFYINCNSAGTPGQVYVFFKMPAGSSSGNDMTDGSSWGAPVGTNPTNLINDLIEELAINNPFILDKMRLTFHFTATPPHLSRIQQSIRLMGNYQANGAVGGLPIYLSEVGVINPENEQELIFDFPIKRLIDGNTMIQVFDGGPNYANYAGFTATFYTSAIADVYDIAQ